MKKLSLVLLICFFANISFGQHQNIEEKPKIWGNDSNRPEDTTSLLSVFKAGKINGHFRYYHSSIRNKGDLSDYQANAIGGGLRFESGNFHGLNMGLSGFYIFNVGSSDLSKKDVKSGQSNRYEIGLFDVTNPQNLNEINRVEELFIKYTKSNSKIIFGRQLINTPFINLQDGRMRPTAVEGLWIETTLSNKNAIQGGWLYSMAPRSTSKWYSMQSSFGLYPAGINGEGVKSDYLGNINTSGAYILNYEFNSFKNLKINLWDMWVENVMNTSLIQTDWEKKLPHGKLYSGTQITFQSKSGNGGNPDETKTYYSNNKPVIIFGGRMGWKSKKWDYSINVNRIGSSGRYLMPREWGRDHFYTFMPRERNEGFGDVTALVGKATFFPRQSTTLHLSYGYFSLPDVLNFELNKYGMPSYTQLNVDLRQKFSGFLNGFEGQVLWIMKWNQGETYDNPKYVIHKVNMNLLNIVVNFRF